MPIRLFKHIAPVIWLLLVTLAPAWSQNTVLTGLVLDAYNKQPLPYANLVFKGSLIGTTADIDGRFALSTSDLTLEKVVVSYLGYDTRTVQVTPGIEQRATIELRPGDKMLGEVDVVASRKLPKDTAAHTLFRQVVKHKPDNAPKNYDNYAYRNYTKTIFGLYDLNERFPERVVVRKLPFVFDNADTLEGGEIVVPALIKETYKHVLYRNQPQRTKEYLLGDRFSGIDNHSLSDLVEFNYRDVDVYANTVNVNGKPIMGPFADNALVSYKYFLTDTQDIGGYYCFKLQFTGRSSRDNVFSGHAWIHDTTFAIRDIYLSLLPQANVNFIGFFELEQGFSRIDGRYWFKDRESLQTHLSLFKKGKRQRFMARKESWRSDIVINHPAIDTLVEGPTRVIPDGARDQTSEFWDLVRAEPIDPKEENVYATADSVLEVPVVKFLKWFLEALQSRYLGAGPLEFGQIDQLYSYNALEGSRIKLGMRTSTKLTERVLLGGHGAYGFRDETWKYGAYARAHLKRRNELWHMLGGAYRYDFSFVGQRDRNDVHDNIFNVLLRRDPIDNIFLTRRASAFYERDWLPGFSTLLDFSHTRYVSVPGKFDFDIDGDGFTSTELGLQLVWSKGMRYYESSSDFERTPITNTRPRLVLTYRASVPRWFGGDLNFHKLELRLSQKLLSPAGYTNYTVYGGKYFGAAPYPLLELHRGNESVYVEKLSFNLMNDFEFASDGYASLWLEHHFDGFIMNRIPGIKYLQLRLLVYGKYLFGWLDDAGNPVVPLPDGMSALNGHYAEVGFGVENILKLLRLDFMWRLTQRDKPEVQRFGVRFAISPKF